MIAFRDRLTRHPTLEAAYREIVRSGAKIPHIFLNQLVHVILRNALDGCEDPFVLRAAELFFRTQRMTLHEGSLIAADEETIAGTVADADLAARVDARHSGRGRDRRDVGRQRRALFRAQRPVPRRARPHRRPARTCGARRSDAALDRARARASRSRSSRSPSCARQSSPGMSGSISTAAGSATRCGTAMSSTRRPPRAWSGCSASPSAIRTS